jgi:hypothetical protein
MSIFSKLFSARNPASASTKTKTSSIGAYIGDDPYKAYATTLQWIRETKAKLPDGSTFEISASMREEAFNADPLLKGTIVPFLKNTLLSGYSIQTEDNKKFVTAIKDIKSYLQDLNLLDVFRADFVDYAIVHGHSYRRKDPGADDVEFLAPLNNSTIHTYQDQWDSTYLAYHQRIYVPDSWSEIAPAIIEYNSWFIPGGKPYIQGELEDPGALEFFNSVKVKYGITDITNLRVDGSERIIAMHRVDPGDPAPIDSAILAIWLKRLLLTNSPNIIFRVLSPFVHIKNGLVLETTENGEKRVVTTVPEIPPSDMAETDPEKYKALLAQHQAWVKACKTAAKDVLKSLKDGGIFASGPDTELSVVESGRSVPSAFIKTMLDLLDQEIGQAFGFPIALVKANGSELATSRTILELFNTTYAGVRHDYERVADELIQNKFSGHSWDYSIPTKEGGTETGTFTFEEMEAKFVLDTIDVRDLLNVAQARLTDAQTLQALKSVGAGKADIQALADEAGFGMLDLDSFDQEGNTPKQQPQALQEEEESTVKSTDEEAEGDALSKKLREAYEAARKVAGDLVGN